MASKAYVVRNKPAKTREGQLTVKKTKFVSEEKYLRDLVAHLAENIKRSVDEKTALESWFKGLGFKGRYLKEAVEIQILELHNKGILQKPGLSVHSGEWRKYDERVQVRQEKEPYLKDLANQIKIAKGMGIRKSISDKIRKRRKGPK